MKIMTIDIVDELKGMAKEATRRPNGLTLFAYEAEALARAAKAIEDLRRGVAELEATRGKV